MSSAAELAVIGIHAGSSFWLRDPDAFRLVAGQRILTGSRIPHVLWSRCRLGEVEGLINIKAGQTYLAEGYCGWPNEGKA